MPSRSRSPSRSVNHSSSLSTLATAPRSRPRATISAASAGGSGTCDEARPGLDVPEQRPVAGDHRGHAGPSCWWKGRMARGGRDETSTTSTPPSRTLAMVRLARSEMWRGPGQQGAVEVDEDQAHHPAGARPAGRARGPRSRGAGAWPGAPSARRPTGWPAGWRRAAAAGRSPPPGSV